MYSKISNNKCGNHFSINDGREAGCRFCILAIKVLKMPLKADNLILYKNFDIIYS